MDRESPNRESPFPPAKRQKIRVQSADRLQQQLQQRENEVARLQQQLQQQEDEVARLQQQLQLQEELHTQSLLFMGVICYGPSFNGKTTDHPLCWNGCPFLYYEDPRQHVQMPTYFAHVR
tara:strand:+ start:116 stop:475 length:360 start_codon:yes stop_codon:yes gene_type:complete